MPKGTDGTEGAQSAKVVITDITKLINTPRTITTGLIETYYIGTMTESYGIVYSSELHHNYLRGCPMY